jgi:3-oxoacyl-[acyl-carrier protein] reductase
MSQPNLAGKVAIVTGGGRGMGRVMALGLAQAGATVVITAAREADEIERVAAENEHIVPVLADVAREADCAMVVESAVARFGRIHILVNNAGRGMKYASSTFMTEPTKFWKVEPGVWRMVIDTNVNGPFLMARAAVPHLLRGGWGRIINISMNRETMRRHGFSPYGPSKAAVESETAIWAQDLAGTGVTVNALLPGGATATGMIPSNASAELRRHLLPPEIMVPPLLWLASEESSSVTGKRIVAKEWRARVDTGLPEAEGMEESGWA